MKIQAIVPAAGAGRRLKSRIPKPLVLLKGKPIFIYALMVMEQCRAIESVIVAVDRRNLREFKRWIQKFGLRKVKHVVSGGVRRSDSVRNALAFLDEDTQAVVVHDAARPFVTADLIEKAVSWFPKEKGVIVALPVKPTIKKVDPKNLYVQETLLRDGLFEVQTPQVFQKELLQEAYRRMLSCDPTDDAVLVEKMGVKVKVIKGDDRNIKITTPEDLKIARAFLTA